jgi:hypothetical protein
MTVGVVFVLFVVHTFVRYYLFRELETVTSPEQTRHEGQFKIRRWC